MSSPHTAADLLQSGGGDLTPSLFPSLSATELNAFLAAKLTEGYVRAAANAPALGTADADGAAIAWAYYKAYLAVWQRLSLSPATAHVEGEATRQYLAVQIQTFKDLADMQLARHEQFLTLAVGQASGNRVICAVPTHFRY